VSDIVDKFVAELLDDIKQGKLKLPILPEVALKVREAVSDPEAAAAKVAKAISSDAAIAARLLQVANSPLYRGANKIESVQNAVARLGPPQVRSLVMSLVMKQLYSTSVPALKDRMVKLWEHSTHVAAICHVLARRFTRLKPDEAMLAGLIHDIGALPILVKAEQHKELLEDVQTLDSIVEKLHASIGRLILEAWRLPPELIEAAAEHENLTRNSKELDITDVVVVANLHSYLGTGHRHAKINWTTVPAFAKLGMTPDQSIKAMEEARSEMSEVKGMLAA
jgi:HD-like signal output (HDOD) protein